MRRGYASSITQKVLLAVEGAEEEAAAVEDAAATVEEAAAVVSAESEESSDAPFLTVKSSDLARVPLESMIWIS